MRTVRFRNKRQSPQFGELFVSQARRLDIRVADSRRSNGFHQSRPDRGDTCQPAFSVARFAPAYQPWQHQDYFGNAEASDSQIHDLTFQLDRINEFPVRQKLNTTN